MAASDFKIENYPNSLVSPELFGRQLSRFATGDVLDGLTVTPGTGLTVALAYGNAMVRYGSGATASARFVSLVANQTLTITTPDVSNPRIDLVVLYVDNNVTLPSGTPTSANLDGPGVAKALVVKGAAAASPSAPNATAIQSAVGSGNPYTVLAQVRVNAGVSVIAANLITDVRDLARFGASKLDLTTFPTLLLTSPAASAFTLSSASTFLTITNLTQVDYNDGFANPSAGVVTIPQDGLYLVAAGVVWNVGATNSVGRAMVQILLNNAVTNYRSVNLTNPTTQDTNESSLTVMMRLSKNDTIAVQGWSSGSSRQTTPGGAYFQLHRIV